MVEEMEMTVSFRIVETNTGVYGFIDAKCWQVIANQEDVIILKQRFKE